MQTHIGIDLGTGNTRIFKGRGIVLSEPSVVTIESRTGKPIEYGKKAYNMIGRTSDRTDTVCPIERGTIANYDVAGAMLTKYLGDTFGKKTLKPKIIITAPSGLTSLQQRSVVDAAERAGARNVCLIESPLAAAIEVGVDFKIPKGKTVVDIGKGTTDVAVLSMGRLAQCESVKLAGIDFDEAIIRYVRKEHNIAIGVLTAERIKIDIGCVMPRPVEVAVTASGLNLFSGLPEYFEITSTQIYWALNDIAESIVKSIQGVFEKTEPELVADSANEGIILTGGASQIYGMGERISDQLKIRVRAVEDPMNCVVRGIGKALSDFSILENGDYRFRSLQDLIIE